MENSKSSTESVNRADEVAKRILEVFKAGSVPKALAPVFIRRKDNVPCRQWSWCNQLLCALVGTADARGFRQWEEVGRHVMKGSKAFYILAPLTKKITTKDAEGKDAERVIVYGFRTVPVFPIESTEGKELPRDSETERWIENLPLLEVAKSWGISVEAFNGYEGRPLGWFRSTGAIALGVQNLSTWAHELIHAADFRLGNLKEHGQHWRSETVAELGGAVLLECLGFQVDSDRGGAWDYIQKYAIAAGIEPFQACCDVLKRMCDAVNLVLTEAEKLSTQHTEHCEAA